jgi:hypothetical protein
MSKRTVQSIKASIKAIKTSLAVVTLEGDASRITGLLIALDAEKQALVDALESDTQWFLLFSDACPSGAIVDAKTYSQLVRCMTFEDRQTHQLVEVDEASLVLFEKFSA